MADLTNKQKKEWAKMLYLKENMTQAEIAEKVGLSRQTVNRLIKDEKLEEYKVGLTMTAEQQITEWMRQIANINRVIAQRPDDQRHPTTAESDTITKLTNSIKKLEADVGIADIISVCTRLLKYSRQIYDLDKVKELTRLFDSFIKENL